MATAGNDRQDGARRRNAKERGIGMHFPTNVNSKGRMLKSHR